MKKRQWKINGVKNDRVNMRRNKKRQSEEKTERKETK